MYSEEKKLTEYERLKRLTTKRERNSVENNEFFLSRAVRLAMTPGDVLNGSEALSNERTATFTRIPRLFRKNGKSSVKEGKRIE